MYKQRSHGNRNPIRFYSAKTYGPVHGALASQIIDKALGMVPPPKRTRYRLGNGLDAYMVPEEIKAKKF